MDGEAVIGMENLTVIMVGNEDVIGWIHGPGKEGGHAVLDNIAPGLFLEGSGPDFVG